VVVAEAVAAIVTDGVGTIVMVAADGDGGDADAAVSNEDVGEVSGLRGGGGGGARGGSCWPMTVAVVVAAAVEGVIAACCRAFIEDTMTASSSVSE
jgi:hypothetical protein